MEHRLAADLDAVLRQTESLWDEVRGERLFITGGTGFFGCWLLESFAWACDRLHLDTEAVVLTRRPEAFARKAPHLASHKSIHLWRGDVTTFAFPVGSFAHVIHAATESSTTLGDDDPLLMLDTIVAGTRRTLDFAVQSQARKFLLTSSGAVYGRQPPQMSHVAEDYPGAPETNAARSAYGEGKRAAELLCCLYAKKHGVQAKIARCFAFVGPYLPLDAHFAVGNFIRDALAGGPVQVKGDGTPYRSYLYAADLAIWLWTILFRGESCRPYNVGSPDGFPIAEIAQTVAEVCAIGSGVRIARAPASNQPAERYVPAVERAERELGLRAGIGLSEGIRRTCRYHGNEQPRNRRVEA